jgi:nucleoside-diphosphate-sugar epimerase
MVIGSGLLGSKLLDRYQDDLNVVIFASGVSSSNETDVNNFKREHDLLINELRKCGQAKFIYFSTMLSGLYDKAYYIHKYNMEQLIRQSESNYIIFRLPQIIGAIGNANNLVNYLKFVIDNGAPITTNYTVKRSIIDIDDVVNIVSKTIGVVNRETINVSGIEKLLLTDIIKLMGEKLNREPIVNFNGSAICDWESENSPIIDRIITELGIDKENYTKKVIHKYIK